MQEYIDKVQGILEPYKSDGRKPTADPIRRKKRDFYFGYADSETRLEMLANIETPQSLLKIEAAKHCI
jgi:hypothetical protein